jgi:hypothetical protein
MKTKMENPSPATLLKREQRERLSNGVPNAKGRQKQCDLANDAVSKSDPKERLQKLMQQNKISVMGLKRCYSDGTIDETALCLLGIPFRRKTVEKTPKKPKNEPKEPVVPIVQVELKDNFKQRNPVYSHDNVASRTKLQADEDNAEELLQEVRRREKATDAELAKLTKTIDSLAPKLSPQTLKQMYLNDERRQLAIDLVNQSGMSLLKIPIGSVRSVFN